MTNTFGTLLYQVRNLRDKAILEATAALLNKHVPIDKEDGIPTYDQRIWDVREETVYLPSGKKVTEIRLYKLVDAATVEIQTQAREVIQQGIQTLGDFPTDPDHPHFYKEAPNDSGGDAPTEDHPTA